MSTATLNLQSNITNKKPYIFSVASGKGGVGKTLTTIHLALSWQNLGNDVLIIDGDLGLANVDVVLGLHANKTINDVIEGECDVTDIAIDGPYGMKILPAGSGITGLSELTSVQRHVLMSKLKAYINRFDVVLIDNGAGVNSNVREFTKMAHETVVVTTPEPHAITDAYALIKVLSESSPDHKMRLLINMARTPREAENVYSRLAEVAMQFLGVSIRYLGFIPNDPQLTTMVRNGQIARGHSAQTLAGQSWRSISSRLDQNVRDEVSRRETVMNAPIQQDYMAY